MSLHVIFADLRRHLIVPNFEAARSAVHQEFPDAHFGPHKSRARRVVQRVWSSLLDAVAEQSSVAWLQREMNETEREAERAAAHLETFGRKSKARPESVMHEEYRCWWEPNVEGARVVDCDGNTLLEGRTPAEILEYLPDAERRVRWFSCRAKEVT